MPDFVGRTVKVTVPEVATTWVPFANRILLGRHLPLSLFVPSLQPFVPLANTPNLPFSNVSTQLKVPGSSWILLGGLVALGVGLTAYGLRAWLIRPRSAAPQRA